MKWFKHLTASTSDPDIMESELRFKANGPYVFFRVLEILAKEDATDKPLIINFLVFKKYFPSTSAKVLLKVLQYFDEKSRISYKINGENIEISCDKLSTISSDYSRKVRTMSEHTLKSVRKKSHLNIEVDKDIDKEENNNTSEREKLFEDFWNYYDKKKDKHKCLLKFKKLTQKELDAIKEHLPKYVKSTPAIQYRKNPLTYLNGKCWYDEITHTQDNNHSGHEVPEQYLNLNY